MSLPYKTGVFHPAFSPWLANPEQLSRTLVGNEEIIRDFLARLAAMDTGSSANHQLLVGPRGIGKTHLLCLTGHYVSRRLPVPEDWAFPASGWICILFTEEEYAGQNSLANFLLTLFEKLGEAIPGESLLCLPSDLAGKPDKVVVECCFETLHRFHEKIGKRLLILVDNLQKVLQQWTPEEHHQLRKFLSVRRFVVILGSAPSVFREVLDQKAALHDFFEIRILSELTSNQVMELLARRFREDQRVDEFNSRREELARKVSAIEVLTGGNPRLVLFLYQIATGSTFWEIETALRMLLEELREYFVRRFDELPDQARKILDTIAQMPGPATPSEIAAAARVRPQLVNAQLQRLKSSHLVRQIKLKRQRATRYDITERLFRIWRQTATVAGRQRFKFLADFLRLYFTPDEIHSLYRQHVAGLNLSTDTAREEILRHVEELFYFQAGGEGEIRYDAFTNRIESLRKLGEMQWAEEEAKYFEAESSKLSDKAGIVEACKQELALHVEAGRLNEALDDLARLLQQDAFDAAISAAETILQHNAHYALAWEGLGIARGNLGQHEGALDAFRRAVEADKPTAGLLALQSLALSGLGRNEEALQAAEQAVNLNSHNSEAWRVLGVAAGNLGNHERALEAFQKAVEIGGATARLWLLRSLALSSLRRNKEALEAAERAVHLDSKDCEAWRALGIAAGSCGNADRALDAFRKAASLGKPTSDLWRLQAIALLILKRSEEALAAAEEAISLDSTNAATWMELGKAAMFTAHYERALEAFCMALEVGKPTAELWKLKSGVLAGLNRWEEALTAAEQAVSLDPTDQTSWMIVGNADLQLGRNDRALEALRNASRVSPSEAVLWRLQAIALKKLNRMDEALHAAAQVTIIAPSESPGWIHKAWIHGYLGQPDEALFALERAGACGALDKDIRHTRGDVLLLCGRYEHALRELEAGLGLDAEDWDMRAGSKVARACLGEFGPLMEALPAQLLMSKIPPGSELAISEFLRDVTLNALRRNETSVPRGLWNALLSLESYHGFEWFGPLCGDFLRRLLDISPGNFVEYAERLREKVKNDGVLRLLDPFLQAAAFIRTKDVSILERVFPEVRELVLDIVRRASPDLITQLRVSAVL
ncbi:MAG: tetratricopeptide repeat protein [Acidobacteriota bacterium]|jgi:tetratricopeptide (TPR) repeat protein/DNA-binding MarR family transcriptional regulator